MDRVLVASCPGRTLLRGFTLVEILTGLALLALISTALYPSFVATRQGANDQIAIELAHQLADNFQHYAAQTGSYPNVCPWRWGSILSNGLGANAELNAGVEPAIFSAPNGQYGSLFAGGAGACGGNHPASAGFVIWFSALGGTKTWYCLDANGLSNVGPSGTGSCL